MGYTKCYISYVCCGNSLLQDCAEALFPRSRRDLLKPDLCSGFLREYDSDFVRRPISDDYIGKSVSIEIAHGNVVDRRHQGELKLRARGRRKLSDSSVENQSENSKFVIAYQSVRLTIQIEVRRLQGHPVCQVSVLCSVDFYERG